jgi:AcrR family transcriptional regulator
MPFPYRTEPVRRNEWARRDDGAVSSPPVGRSGRPPRTSRAQILAAANEIIERDGWQKLTIRRLAAEVGVGTMTIYHHVRDREDLLVQLVNDQADQFPSPDLPDDPRERIILAATTMHDALAARPWVTEIVTTDGFLSRVGVPAARLVDAIVGGALDAGCTPEQSILVFRNIWYYSTGEILVRAHTRSRRTGDNVADGRDQVFSSPDPSIGAQHAPELPRLAAVGGLWAEVAQRDTFAEGLRALVDGLLRSHLGPVDDRD